MIIAIGGELQNGKSLLARYLVETKGFKQVSFAKKLKELVAELYNVDISVLYTSKKDELLEKPLQFGAKERKKLEKIINAKKELIAIDYTFASLRNALQIIGTEVLRNYDQNYHVKEFRNLVWNWRDNRLHDYAHFVCDDVRFGNEMHSLRLMDAKTIYVDNPRVESVSKHSSETSLVQADFDYAILNDSSISVLIERFDRCFADFQEEFAKNDTTPAYSIASIPDEPEAVTV